MGVTFDFPIHRQHVAPSFNEGAWVSVPPIMEKLKAARPFFCKVPDSPEQGFARSIHLVNGRIYGCTGYSAVEFEVGDTGLPGIALKPEDISILASFRQEVTRGDEPAGCPPHICTKPCSPHPRG